MKVLILFFSMTGRTKKVAENIAEGLNSLDVRIEEIKYAKKVRDLLKEKEEIMKGDLSNFNYDENIKDLEPYDLIFFGTPTYGARAPPVFDGYLEIANNVSGKRFIVFNTCRFIAGKILELIQAEIEKKGAEVVNKRIFKGFFRINMKKVRNFIDELNKELLINSK
ncbi:hypothetical protein AC481_00195 [miscellaneous Crenarchaeota group archaeon SMTZ-80]|nr:MAG: hypothetical protein AC481_00195 [miscellaneous Crenarchaeota group archaeon SMTZ-80]